MAKRTALVVGAQGVIGGRLVEHLAGLPDWEVVGVSRRGGVDREGVRHLRLDLLDADAARSALRAEPGITHLFHAGYQDAPTRAALLGPNLAMLENALDAVESASGELRHVSLMQGYKVYGAHLGPFPTPAREEDAGHLGPEFNLAQQALLEARAGRWTWSAMRPSVVCGTALGNPMNLVLVIAVLAAFSRELGVPLRFPGRPGAYDPLLETTDAGLLARATVWAATDPAGANQAFNVTNGDLFRWRDLWPRLAAMLDVPVGPPLPMSLVEAMADQAPVWDRIVARHGLRPNPFEQVSSWAFGDAVLAWDYDFLSDASKLRRAGFTEQVRTDDMFAGLFDRLRRDRIVP